MVVRVVSRVKIWVSGWSAEPEHGYQGRQQSQNLGIRSVSRVGNWVSAGWSAESEPGHQNQNMVSRAVSRFRTWVQDCQQNQNMGIRMVSRVRTWVSESEQLSGWSAESEHGYQDAQ
jgi:hypothetical protein